MNLELYCDLGDGDDAPDLETLLKPENADLIRRSPLTGLRLICESSDGKRRVYSPVEVQRVVHAFPGLFVRLVLWPHPQAKRDYIEWVWNMTLETGCDPVYDIEHQAISEADRMAMSRTLIDLPWGEVTTHQGHPELTRTSHYMRLLPNEVQALSTKSAVEKYGRIASPGRCQQRAVRLGETCNGYIPSVTLPLYGQTGLGDPDIALTNAFRACMDEGVQTISFWSLKHLLAIGYAREFLLDTVPRLLSMDVQESGAV